MVIRDGKVAIQYHTSNMYPPVQVGEVTYSPALQHNVALIWVAEGEAETIINSPANRMKSCDCDGGTYKPRLFYASEINVSVFETGDYPR